jgi:hypothetical protein
MFNFNISQIANSFSIFSFNYSVKKEIESQKKEQIQKKEDNESVSHKRDYKTTMSGSKIELIGKLNEDIVIYLFIQKEKENGISWNLVVPIVKCLTSNTILQYGLGFFALQGSGGGLNSTNSIFISAKKLKEKGYNVIFSPRVIKNNQLLKEFEYCDNNLTLDDLDKNSIPLCNYLINDTFESIYKKYNEFIERYFSNNDKKHNYYEF